MAKHQTFKPPHPSWRIAPDVRPGGVERPDPLRALVMAELWAAIDNAPHRGVQNS